MMKGVGDRRLLHIVTDPMTARILMRHQLGWFASRGWQLGVACGAGDTGDLSEVATVFEIPIAREISPFADVRAMFALWVVIRRFKPDLLVAGTPKAGLLGMMAGWLARVPARIYLLRGLRLETTSGLRRAILATAERVTTRLSGRVLAVSDSLARRCVELGLVRADKITVPAPGSSNGVDLERYYPAGRGAAREGRGLDADETVIGFVGRLTQDKGVVDLVAAFDLVRSRTRSPVRLLLLGDAEPGDPIGEATLRRLRDDPSITCVGFVDDPANYYRTMDVLAFPSSREGFPNVPLEAAASGVPVAAYAVTGTVDAVFPETGVLAEAGDVPKLAGAIERCLELRSDPNFVARCRGRVERFGQEHVWRAWEVAYADVIAGADNKQGPGS